MSDLLRESQKSILDIRDGETEHAGERVDHANNVRINVTSNEVTLDFYQIMSDSKSVSEQPQVNHVQRIILPVEVAKEAGELLIASMDDQLTSTATAQLAESGEALLEQAWGDLDALWAKWDRQGDLEDDLETDWLEELRAGSDRRLNELYDPDSR
jgi:hypothetical protein